MYFIYDVYFMIAKGRSNFYFCQIVYEKGTLYEIYISMDFQLLFSFLFLCGTFGISFLKTILMSLYSISSEIVYFVNILISAF